jgi:hypothetical protein
MEGERANEFARVILGVVLFTLVMGLWAYLWVPSSPVF